MSDLRVPNDGVRGIDVQTESGVVKYDADRTGKVSVDNPKHARQMRAEGFTAAPLASGFAIVGFPCSCGFNSVFRKCGRCGKEN
jgi:hypothetical protein